MVPTAIECGISINDYWDLTIGEIVQYFEAYRHKISVERQDKLYLSYQTALLTASFVSNSLNGQAQPSFYELFPSLMSDEDKAKMEEEKKQKELEILKSQLTAFMVGHNNQNKK